MTNREIEQLSEITSTKTAEKTIEKVISIVDRMITEKISLHYAQCGGKNVDGKISDHVKDCELKKFGAVKILSIAGISAILVKGVEWIMGKL